MNNNTKIVVVTGGAGFIGSHLVRALLERGYAVRVIDSLVAGKRENIPAEAELFQIDIRDKEALAPVFANVEKVFHLAALPAVGYSLEHPQETHEVNVTGFVNVLASAKESGVQRVVFASSSAIYGSHEESPLTEELSPILLSPYALHKRISEEYLALFSQLYGLETVALRFFNVYGPGFDPDGPYAAVIGRFIKLRQEGKPLTIVGDGTQTRDFVHVRDIARALIAAAESPAVGKGEILNIGTGQEVSVNELADMFGGNSVSLPPRVEPHASRADITKAKKFLGWEPSVSFSEGIAELLATV